MFISKFFAHLWAVLVALVTILTASSAQARVELWKSDWNLMGVSLLVTES